MDDIENVAAVTKPTFKARVTVFVALSFEVEPEGDHELPVRAASNRAATAAYARVRDAFGSYAVERAPRVEVIA